MDDRPKIELQKHVAKRVSRKYLLKILFYVVLIAVILLIYKVYGEDKGVAKQDPTEVNEVRNITIEQ